jgi:hypothetical protein
MPLHEIFLIINGYHQRNIDEWKRTRVVAYSIAAANRNPKKPFPSIEKFMPLPGDDEAMKAKAKRRKQEYEQTKERYKKLGVI